MKPVTIETVRERLSYLEGLNERGVGTAVSQQQFETACLRELLTLLDELEKEKGYTSAFEAEKWHYHGLAESEGERADRAEKALEASEKRIAELQSSVIAPGIMRCAGCGFVLTKNNINMAAGTITAGDSDTEPCPNGCGPLWPVTWKEQALQMRDDSEQWFDEVQQSRQRIAELETQKANLMEHVLNGYEVTALTMTLRKMSSCSPDYLRFCGIYGVDHDAIIDKLDYQSFVLSRVINEDLRQDEAACSLAAENEELKRRKPELERELVRREHAEWSDATFGSIGPVGPLKHLSKEALEAAADPSDSLVWADMQFLLWDAQRRMGISDRFITRAMIEKLAINKTRQWPEPKDGDPQMHIKEQPVPVVPDVLERLRIIVSDPRALPRRKEWISGQQYNYVLLENVEALVEEACRAAMLKGDAK